MRSSAFCIIAADYFIAGKFRRSDEQGDGFSKTDNTEDILEKYRTGNSLSANQGKLSSRGGSTGSFGIGGGASGGATADFEEEEERMAPIYDEDNLEKCLAFAGARYLASQY